MISKISLYGVKRKGEEWRDEERRKVEGTEEGGEILAEGFLEGSGVL